MGSGNSYKMPKADGSASKAQRAVDCPAQLFPLPEGDASLMNWSTAAEAILRGVPTGLMVCNSHGKITLVNAAAKQLAQVDPEGKTVYMAPSIWGEMFDQNGKHVPTAQWPCIRALRGEATSNMECRMVRHDQSTYDVLFSSSPIGVAREGLGSINTFPDITQSKL